MRELFVLAVCHKSIGRANVIRLVKYIDTLQDSICEIGYKFWLCTRIEIICVSQMSPVVNWCNSRRYIHSSRLDSRKGTLTKEASVSKGFVAPLILLRTFHVH